MKEWIASNISVSISDQMWLIVVSIIAGIIMGIIYDFFRGLRRVRKLKRVVKGRWKVHFEDALFLFCYVMVTYYIFYRYHNGSVAGYVYLNQILGILLYYKIVHNWGRCLFTCILWQICTVTRRFLGIITIPFRVICGKIIKILKSIMKSIKIIFINN